MLSITTGIGREDDDTSVTSLFIDFSGPGILEANEDNWWSPLYKICSVHGFRGYENDLAAIPWARLLLERGANVNARFWGEVDGETPLMLVMEDCHPGFVELLLEYGADGSLKDERGWTALDSAMNGWEWKVGVELLRRYGQAVEGVGRIVEATEALNLEGNEEANSNAEGNGEENGEGNREGNE
jgi:hypothetical protein